MRFKGFKQLIKIMLLFGFNISLSAQADSSWQQMPKLDILGFADVFYVYDFNKPQSTFRQPFLFNHNRHNEFNLNLGFIKFGLLHKKYKANLALQTGTYANDNYVAEPGLLKNIFEANIGISLNKKNNIWLEAGVFPSHIGFESAVSIDNWTLTRSILAENSPYFLSGAKLIFSPNKKFDITFLTLNGWQRIQRLQGASMPSFGTQVYYNFSDKIKLNWSTFIGTDDPDTLRRWRYFNNFYGQFLLTNKFGLIAGLDLGMQQKTKNSLEYDFWFSTIIIAQLAINKSWKTSVRAEYYQDKTGIIILTGTSNGFKTTGLSLNIDYSPVKNIACRVEGRWLNSRDNIFEAKTSTTNNNFILATSIALKFSETITK